VVRKSGAVVHQGRRLAGDGGHGVPSGTVLAAGRRGGFEVAVLTRSCNAAVAHSGGAKADRVDGVARDVWVPGRRRRPCADRSPTALEVRAWPLVRRQVSE